MAPGDLSLGDVVAVRRSFETRSRARDDGYMKARVGDSVRVLYIGAGGGAEDGWLYVSTPTETRKGWLPREHVGTRETPPAEPPVTPPAAPAAECSLAASVLWKAVVRCRVQSSGQGYIAVSEGEHVEVLHSGSGEEDDWLYVRGSAGGALGWLPRDAADPARQQCTELPVPANKAGADAGAGGTTSAGGAAGAAASTLEAGRGALGGGCGPRPSLALAQRESEQPGPPGGAAAAAGPAEAPEALPPRPSRPPPAPDDAAAPAPAARPPGGAAPLPEPTVAAAAWLRRGVEGPPARPPGRWPAQPPEGQAMPPPAPAASSLEGRSSGAAPAQGSRCGSLRLLTFGVENCDSQLVDRCFRGAGGASETFGDGELKEALARLGFPQVDVVCDARDFPDPDARGLTWHTGHNHEIIARIVRHRNFRRWLRALSQKFSQACRETASSSAGGGDGPVALTIAVYCKSGKHRSVATALILKRILVAQGWHCDEIRHLSEKRWERCCRGRCEECTQPPDDLEETYEWALRIWQSVQCGHDSVCTRGFSSGEPPPASSFAT